MHNFPIKFLLGKTLKIDTSREQSSSTLGVPHFPAEQDQMPEMPSLKFQGCGRVLAHGTLWEVFS